MATAGANPDAIPRKVTMEVETLNTDLTAALKDARDLLTAGKARKGAAANQQAGIKKLMQQGTASCKKVDDLMK